MFYYQPTRTVIVQNGVFTVLGVVVKMNINNIWKEIQEIDAQLAEIWRIK
jgi:hypothetical protein